MRPSDLLQILDSLPPLNVLALDLPDQPEHEVISAAISQLVVMEKAASDLADKLEHLSPATTPTNVWSFPL